MIRRGQRPPAPDRRTGPEDDGQAIRRPSGTDWAWRPLPWRGPVAGAEILSPTAGTPISADTRVFHDCPRSDLAVRLTPADVGIAVLSFAGSYLSLAIDLPEAAVAGLRPTHLIRCEARVAAHMPAPMTVRLNLQRGPNTERLVRAIPAGTADVVVEFDLAALPATGTRVEKIWVDLIWERPGPMALTILDVTFTRRPRAAL